jgi:hypothetical protein
VNRRNAWIAVGLVFASGTARADVDQERQAWRYRRSLSVPAQLPASSPFAALPLPPEVSARSQADLRDLRLLDGEGHEHPFVVDAVVAQTAPESWAGRLVDARREAGRSSLWVVDLGESRRFESIDLEIPGQDFAKGLRVEGSEDGQSWRVLREDAGVFDRIFGSRVHHTRIDLPVTASARFLRFSAADRRSAPVEVHGCTVFRRGQTEGTEWTRPVAVTKLAGAAGVSRYRLDVAPGFPVEAFDLDADDPAFHRSVKILELTESGGRHEERPLGQAVLYRLRIPGELSAEAVALPVRRAEAGSLVLEVEDGDSPPLHGIRLIARGAAARLLFPATDDARLTLYYGNEATRPPVYDLDLLKQRLTGVGVRVAELGPEQQNPSFRAAPPLAFVPTTGAGLDVTRWRAERRLNTLPREDLYALVLGGADLGLLRPDLGDLRVIDASDRQVPYVLFPDAGEERLALEVVRETCEGDARAASCYVLRAPAVLGVRVSLPERRLELSFAEAFFDRPARLVAPPAVVSRRSSDEILFEGRLARAAGHQGPLSIALDGAYRSELRLRIEEGDNAPLTLSGASVVVRVPRLALKTGAGPLRLVLGNAEATVPHYDIAALRQDVLSYSAVPLQPAELAANPAFRRRAGDFLREAPPTALLWGALGTAVLALLYLTVRLLKTPDVTAKP